VELHRIGKLEEINGISTIVIDEKFQRGLKQIEYFSHLHTFWLYENSIEHSVEEKTESPKGVICIKNSLIPKGSTIIDIKAYLPSEDRVKECLVPEYLKNKRNVYTEQRTLSDASVIDPIGKIERKEGKISVLIDEDYRNQLQRIEGFSHIKLIWYFNRLDNPTLRNMLVCKPPYEAPKTGVFASRAPVRPNPLALTICRINHLDISRGIIEIDDCDAFTGSPVLKLIPYFPSADRVDGCEVPPWLSHWPQWFTERQAIDNEINVKPADIQKLMNYTVTELETEKIGLNEDKIIRGTSKKNSINIIGARQNNLKNIDVSIPLGKLTVVTGVSGSGKSSLAFDTVYAEGQRRYMQSLSTSSRMAAGLIEKPDFDNIENLLPAVAIEQKRMINNPRSTIGTVSDVYSYLRLLYAKVGTRHCRTCGTEISPQSVEALYKKIDNLLPDTKLSFFPGRENLKSKPLFIYVTGENKDRQLSDIISQSYSEGFGFITIVVNDDVPLIVTERDACTNCDTILFKMSPSLFSYNSPVGMCPACNGIGIKMDVDPQKIVSKPDLSLLDGASQWYGDLRSHRKKPNANWFRNEVLALAEEMDIDLEKPWNSLPDDFKQVALYGSGDKIYEYTYNSGKTGRSGTISRPVGGAVKHLERLFTNSRAGNSLETYKQFMTYKPCSDCSGERLSMEGRLVTFGGRRFPEAASLTIEEACEWVNSIPRLLSERSLKAVQNLLDELHVQLQSMLKLGLYYLTLDRPVTTLSGGEAQRIKLAGQLRCGLSGLLYVLDEPSIGLHPRDHGKMIDTMKELRDSGNTVLVVEHDAETIMAADHIIDIGKGAGINGGYIIAEGSPGDILKNPSSITGEFIKSSGNIDLPDVNKAEKYIHIKGATLHNLKYVDAGFPIGRVSCVTGVSGSGKSSLVRGTLIPALQKKINGMDVESGEYSSIDGIEDISRIISVDQSSIGRSPKSVPATYIGLFDEIRKIFARTPQAKQMKYKINHFSFNDKNGRCPNCEGAGKIKIDMSFLPDSWVTCSDCEGKRYNRDILDITYRGRNIWEVLEMDANQALELFSDEDSVAGYLKTLKDVGLDYLKLGQSSRTLSGGEAQRIKLAKELTKKEAGNNLYILDEPTTGLHFSDISKLLKIVHRLASLGNTIIIIEHNIDVIKTSHWIVDLGPSGGDKGGSVVGEGTPVEIAGIEASFTGSYLKESYS